jgi:hypothetical protein
MLKQYFNTYVNGSITDMNFLSEIKNLTDITGSFTPMQSSKSRNEKFNYLLCYFFHEFHHRDPWDIK